MQQGKRAMSTPNKNPALLPCISLGFLLALGLIIAALIVAHSAKQVAGSRESITVKGTAEKAVKADKAIWGTTISVYADSIATALPLLQQQVAQAKTELTKNNLIAANQLQIADWRSEPQYQNYKDEAGNERNRLVGYTLSQHIGAVLTDVTVPAKINDVINQLILRDINIEKSDTQYLVSNIESVKLSLIAAATKNAHDRALEFAKSGDVDVSNMRSASQGVFQINAPLSTGSDEYGGEYDTSTIDKVARVVVTVNYGIQ
jgi:hypothetical protein